MGRTSRWAALAVFALIAAGLLVAWSRSDGGSPAEGTADLPPIPAGLPRTLELGIASPDGHAARTNEIAPFGFRYQYLAGGVGDSGWQSWNEDGRYVACYIEESADAGPRPVFSYYMLLQSTPATEGWGERDRLQSGLQDAALLRAYYEDLAAFFQQAGEYPDTTIVLHVEPDLWGYAQQLSPGDDGGALPTAVAATGLPGLADLPDTFAGFAQAIVRLRDETAPNVLLAYHLSSWATAQDIVYSDPPLAEVIRVAARSAAFYDSLEARFDLTFAEYADRDAAFKDGHVGGPSWWNAGDFERQVTVLTRFVTLTGLRAVLWQIPLGNTVYRTLDNSDGHYQDNRVEWLLGEESRKHLAAYADAGVIALLFGRGAHLQTSPADYAGDGVTNPEPINGNTAIATSTDDDGGYFRVMAAEYYAAGPLALTG